MTVELVPVLFDPGEPEFDSAGNPKKLSADQRRTALRKAQLRQGIHPATRSGLLDPPGPTCGDCAHHFVNRCAHNYHKCEYTATQGAGSDIRVSWPACSLFKPIDPPERTQ